MHLNTTLLSILISDCMFPLWVSLWIFSSISHYSSWISWMINICITTTTLFNNGMPRILSHTIPMLCCAHLKNEKLHCLVCIFFCRLLSLRVIAHYTIAFKSLVQTVCKGCVQTERQSVNWTFDSTRGWSTWFMTSSCVIDSTLWPRPYCSLYPIRWYKFHPLCVCLRARTQGSELRGKPNMISAWVVIFCNFVGSKCTIGSVIWKK